MKKQIKSVLLFSALGLSLVSCNERIDAGYEGIKVNMYGSEKGVSDVSLVTGRVWYNPFTEDVYEFPTFVQTFDYEEFGLNTKDGSKFTVDPTMSISIKSGESPKIFKKYRKDMNQIMTTTLANHIKDVYRIEFNKYTTDEIISSREKFEDGIQKKMNEFFAKEGFVLEQLTSGITPPESITKAIDAKNKAVQDAQRVENELRVVEAQARKVVVQAEAESQAYKLKQQALTPLLIQQQAIEKWDGKLPSTMAGGQLPFVKSL